MQSVPQNSSFRAAVLESEIDYYRNKMRNLEGLNRRCGGAICPNFSEYVLQFVRLFDGMRLCADDYRRGFGDPTRARMLITESTILYSRVEQHFQPIFRWARYDNS
ncbi:unnamed protein product [Caenorhabditis bovis]|uniref:Uncharacterized protein n=1 Tax=Caenorhabditis bovis TaxID=2654633 RepID=A0A8S1FFJ9_9PELO|nr:unnamed protein product [Caenorhabditis bovis]